MKLASMLSVGAHICRPGSECFRNATTRFVSGWAAPNFDLVVEAATAEDVQQTVKYANDHDMPFLAVSGKHGFTKSLGEMKHGIGIYMQQMTDVKIAENGQTAIIGGGITSRQLIDHIWPRGKQSTIGACECTGVVSPMLGGGHGFLKGQYSLMTDNLISANVVLSNGSAITVSQSQHPELFWAMRGAGHTFGIVTSFQYKIHDRTPENELWSLEQMIFPTDKLEAVYEEAEKQRQTAPVELGHWGAVVPVLENDPITHSLVFTVIYQGSQLPSKYTDPFHALEPIMTVSDVTAFPGISKVLGMDMSSQLCQPGGPTFTNYPVNLESYNSTALREAVDVLLSMPPEFRFSSMLIEGYSGDAVRAILEDSTAYAHRKQGILVGNFIQADLAHEALKYGARVQEPLVRGSLDRKLHSYVNYAAGNEPRGALYGHEPWRLKKLRKLEAEYDPYGRFNFYLPINGPAWKEDGICTTKTEL